MRPTTPELVGRQAAWESIRAAFTDAVRGRLRVALCVGDPGIGKSHLLAVAAERLAAAGALVLQGGASEAEAMPPYLPFLEALGPWIRQAPIEQVLSDVGSGALVLTTVFPDLTARLRDPVASPALPPAQARLRLFEAIGSYLAALAARQPLVLILDDLQWADTASLDLLTYVAGHQPAARLLILGAYQEAAVATHPALERALVTLHRTLRPERIALPPLDAGQTAELGRIVLRAPLSPESALALQAHSEGNPFFAVELLRGWQHADALHRTPQGWALRGGDTLAIPASILSAVRLRIGRLPAQAIDPLRVASVIGRSFGIDLLAQVVGEPVEAVEVRLMEAAAHHLVEADDTGEYRFAHDIIRACLFREVSTSRRRQLHARIGAAIEDRAGAPAVQRLDELAFHFSRSDDAERGAAYSKQAAQRAHSAFAFEQAAGHWEAVLRQLPHEAETRGAALLGLGEALLLAAREEAAADAFQAADAWHAARNEAAGRIQALRGLGICLWRRDALDRARSVLEEALVLLDAFPDPAPEAVRTRVELATLLGNVLAEPTLALQHASVAHQLAGSLQDPHLQASAGRTMGFLLVLENRMEEAIPLLERALQLALRADDMAEAAECGSALAQAYVWSGHLSQAVRVSRQRLEHALRAQQPYRLHYVHTWLAFLAAARGEWAEAEACLDLARSSLSGAASVRPHAFLHQIEGYLSYQCGCFAKAKEHFRAALVVFHEKDPLEYQLCVGMMGLTHFALGEESQAAGSLREQVGMLAVQRSGSLPYASAASTLLLLASGVGDRARTASLLLELQACRGQHHWFLVDRILAAGEALLGNEAAAHAHLDAAESLARREGLLPELERVLRARAALIATHPGEGAAQAAGSVQSEAAGLAERLGLPPSRSAASDRTPTHPPLSPREAQVLRLVATGLSSRQISEQLCLSPHTVAKHLTSIFTKLGVGNRAAATAYAIRHGLD